jgi:hypothetical protein
VRECAASPGPESRRPWQRGQVRPSQFCGTKLRVVFVKHSPRLVLVLAGRLRGKSHDPDCKWVEGVNLDYVRVDAAVLPARIGRCSWCGGGPRSPVVKRST